MQDIGIALQPACGASTIPESPRKNWLLKRNCSLSPRQVGWFYLSIVILSFAIATFFTWQGAWFVLPFSGLEVACLGWALLYHARHASDYEHIRLDADRLVVEQVSAGRKACHEFNARWVRVELKGPLREQVALCSSGRVVRIGRYLDPAGRRRLADELSRCLGLGSPPHVP
ncbi:hypothetical protein LMG7141_03197 [Ralstonia condita]|uniref:DUF2244 domain-containing protein n=1 Tax=Ralstonia condita TaxID=3058600 RepID=A0ABM9JJW0_9RALS|nr:DUF2244 domain-containing protein [Ralstonia sp. LMG 7141]CAJ0796165.1 hypothetical protein LMG7141_03197 [Ralstonia sp. LMG 7141]